MDSPALDSPLLRFSIRVTVAATVRSTSAASVPPVAAVAVAFVGQVERDGSERRRLGRVGGPVGVDSRRAGVRQAAEPGDLVPAGRADACGALRGRQAAQPVGERAVEVPPSAAWSRESRLGTRARARTPGTGRLAAGGSPRQRPSRRPAPEAGCRPAARRRPSAAGARGAPGTGSPGEPGCRVSTLARVRSGAWRMLRASAWARSRPATWTSASSRACATSKSKAPRTFRSRSMASASSTALAWPRSRALARSPGDGVGQRASAGEVEGPEEAGVGGAGVRDDVGAGEVEGVRVGQDDGVGVRVHELDRASVGVSAGGQVVGEGAAQRADVVEVADDIQGHVEDRRGEYLGQYRGVPGVVRDGLADGGAGQRVRVGLAGTEPQSRRRLRSTRTSRRPGAGRSGRRRWPPAGVHRGAGA